MQINYKKIIVPPQEVADVFISKIVGFDIEPDATGDFSNKFDFEHEWIVDGKPLTIFFFGRLSGSITIEKIGDEPDWEKMEARYFDYYEFAAYFDGDDLEINDSDIYELIEKEIQI